jgi:uncharacterized coiled-coil DUF342 family protein
MPENRRCTLCDQPHSTKTKGSAKFLSIDSAAANKLLADTPGAEGAVPWTSEHGCCFKAGGFVLLLAPANPPEEGDISFFSCSKAYQAKSSLLLKYKHDQALKATAAVAAASTPRQDVVAPPTHGTRGLTTTQNELDEAHHQLESKSALVVELDTKLDHTQSDLASARVDLNGARVELGEAHNELGSKNAMVLELDTKLGSRTAELAVTRTQLGSRTAELAVTRTQLGSRTAELAVTRTQLEETHHKLAETHEDLVDTRVELGMKHVELKAAHEALNICKKALATASRQHAGFRDKVRHMLNGGNITWTGSLDVGLKRGRDSILRLKGQVARFHESSASATQLRRKHGVNWAELVDEAMKQSPDLEAELDACKEESKKLKLEMKDVHYRMQNFINDKATLKHEGLMADLRMSDKLAALVSEGEANKLRLAQVETERDVLVGKVFDISGEMEALSQGADAAAAVDKAAIDEAADAADEEDPEYDQGGDQGGRNGDETNGSSGGVTVTIKHTMIKKRKSMHGGAPMQYTTELINKYVDVTRQNPKPQTLDPKL